VTAPTDTAAEPSRAVLDESRFTTSRSTLFLDRFMTWFIRVGGALVIMAVSTIFLFIGWRILPLFRGATVAELRTIAVPAGDWCELVSDEGGERPLLVDRAGHVVEVDAVGDGAPVAVAVDLGAAKRITAARWDAAHGQLTLGLDDGRFLVRAVHWPAGAAVELEPLYDYRLGAEAAGLSDVAFRDAGAAKLAAGIVDQGDGRRTVRALTLVQKMVMGRRGKLATGIEADLGPQIEGTPSRVLVDDAAESVVVATVEGDVFYFHLDDDAFVLRQRFRPFVAGPAGIIASIDYLNGGVSLVVTGLAGENSVWSLYEQGEARRRLFGEINRLDPLPAGATAFDASIRTKAFVVAAGSSVSLRYATTGAVRWAGALDGRMVQAAIDGKNDRMLLLDDASRLHVLSLSDKHPEAGFRAFFGKVWYEGAPGPAYTWQSSGGSDQNEPKLSLVPLLVGTLKGAFFALLFAIPIALLAAIYTSEFMNPRLKAYVKPMMELMASLPSVVLGFIAALWLAPVLAARVPTLAVAVVLVPLAAMGFGWGWTRLPVRLRSLLKPGWEFIVFMPILLIAVIAAALLGPLLEMLVCRVTDPATGATIADFRLWWPHVTGSSFEMRNSLVVGLAMGFAVIPIIYTISDDALSAVPATLRSASLALGASRWQTAIRVVVPTAAAGIFSAVMIGFGRAVGETMIVVMATGNTPIMDLNLFTGMRTLAANIAVELSEAPEGGTLYRTLYLCAMVLFVMTFTVNTVAEIIRQRLREKYKTV
jgi:phosphate transport system permease protein